MLRAIGVESIEDLFASIPSRLRRTDPLSLPAPLDEATVLRMAREAAAATAQPLSFLGAGTYTHHISPLVDALVSRGEFLTSYTPYQPEISQGNLQALFEFQTLVAMITELDVANSSLYDGPSALAEAVLMARAQTRRDRVLLPATLHPHYAEVVRTYLRFLADCVVEIPEEDGCIALASLNEHLDDRVACVVLSSPNRYGLLEATGPLAAAVRGAGAIPVAAVVDPVSLALLQPPGAWGADIAAGELQPLGMPPSYGGPHLGFLAAREVFLRRMPGRMVGQTVDREGRRGFVLTLQTREQHIRRAKASSNICTNQALMALRASIHLALLGRGGFVDLADTCCRKAHGLAERIGAIPGFELAHLRPFFREFPVRGPRPARDVLSALAREGILGGFDLARWDPHREREFLIAVSEIHSEADMDRLVDGLAVAGGGA